MTLLNPNAAPGHNEAPPYAQAVTDRMRDEYGELERNAEDLIESTSALPARTVAKPDDIPAISAAVVKLRDLHSRAKAFHKKEKEPFLRGGEGVDAFFFTIMEKAEATGKALNVIVNDIKQRQLAEERERRRLAEAEARRIEDEARAKHEAETMAARQAAEAAERARKPETIEKHEERAEQHTSAAELARIDTMVAQAQADVARNATLAKPSVMVGERFDAAGIGGKVTMRQVGFVAVEDYSKLDKELLWALMKDDEKLRALKAWAKLTGYTKPMEGAIIEMRDATVIR